MDFAKSQLVARVIGEYLKKQAVLLDERMAALRLSFKTGRLPDYEQDAVSFASAFWERNFWKAIYFFHFEYIRPSVLQVHGFVDDSVFKIVVLGAGSAADTVACMLWLDAALPLRKVAFTLIDQSHKQLELARGIIDQTSSFFEQVAYDIKYECHNTGDWLPEANSADLILMSHFLTENSQEKEVLIEKVISSLTPCGDVLIIERQRDPIWCWARSRLAICGVTTHEVGLCEDKFGLLSSILPHTEVDISPSYVRGSIPANKRLMEIVRGYFMAWTQQSSDSLGEIFSSKAVYEEKPGIEPPIIGIEGIRRYWDKHPGLQSNLRLKVHNVAYSDTVSVCSFSGEFDTPKQHIVIQGALNFYLDPYLGKVHRFTEYFGTCKTALSE